MGRWEVSLTQWEGLKGGEAWFPNPQIGMQLPGKGRNGRWGGKNKRCPLNEVKRGLWRGVRVRISIEWIRHLCVPLQRHGAHLLFQLMIGALRCDLTTPLLSLCHLSGSVLTLCNLEMWDVNVHEATLDQRDSELMAKCFPFYSSEWTHPRYVSLGISDNPKVLSHQSPTSGPPMARLVLALASCLSFTPAPWDHFLNKLFTQKPLSQTLILGGDFPGGAVIKGLPANAGDTGLSPGLGRSHTLRSN